MKFKVKEIERHVLDEGSVSIYEMKGLFIVTYTDGGDEVIWGYGSSLEDALEKAEKEWGKLVGGKNPFTVILRKEGA